MCGNTAVSMNKHRKLFVVSERERESDRESNREISGLVTYTTPPSCTPVKATVE